LADCGISQRSEAFLDFLPFPITALLKTIAIFSNKICVSKIELSRKMNLLDLPQTVILDILEMMPYDEVAKKREVSWLTLSILGVSVIHD